MKSSLAFPATIPWKKRLHLCLQKKSHHSRLVQGDELLVQVTRESVKTKAPTVSGNLNLTGRYLVVTSGDCRLSFSSKLTKAEKEQFRTLLEPEWDGSYGIIVLYKRKRS